jgi:LuxR family maltose regulon positive regulatory protein
MSAFQQAQLLDFHELLSTKLALPRLRSPWVPRQRLLDRLDAGLEQKLTLISAPAGFGKTTLVTEWAYGMKDVAWVSLDTGDNDPIRFWRYVLTACQAFGNGIGSSALTILHTSQEPSLEAMLTRLINDLVQLPDKKVLVLEDYHLITSQKIHETLGFLIDHLPGTLHPVLLTRTDPPLPLARLRARNELAELRAADLRFSRPEIEIFVQQAIPYPLPEGAIVRLEERTEGWAAGMRLVALTFQGRQEPGQIEQLLDTVAGAHRPFLEYLVLEVLGTQPEPLQEYMLQTSF